MFQATIILIELVNEFINKQYKEQGVMLRSVTLPQLTFTIKNRQAALYKDPMSL